MGFDAHLPETDTFVVFLLLWGSIILITVVYLCRQVYLKIKEYLPIYLKKRKEQKSKKNSLPMSDMESTSMLHVSSGVVVPQGDSASEGIARLHCVPENGRPLECPVATVSSSAVGTPLEWSPSNKEIIL